MTSIKSAQFVKPVRLPGRPHCESLDLGSQPDAISYELSGGIDGPLRVLHRESGEVAIIPISNLAAVRYLPEPVTLAPPIEMLRDAAEVVLPKRGPGRPPKR